MDPVQNLFWIAEKGRRGEDWGAMKVEEVVLVDEADREVGRAEKLWAHQGGGKRHRAFSVMLLDGQGRVLLQRRAGGKYHFPGLWTNACCSHPRPGEGVLAAGQRRLTEELGLDGVELREAGVFEYRAESQATGLWEWEVDHVLVGRWDGAAESLPVDASEVEAVRWASSAEIDAMVAEGRDVTPWFAIIWRRWREWGKAGPGEALEKGK